jgi:hypothetical protein
MNALRLMKPLRPSQTHWLCYTGSTYLISQRHLTYNVSLMPPVLTLPTSTHLASTLHAYTPRTKRPAPLTFTYIPAKNSHWCHLYSVWLAWHYVIPCSHWLQLGGGFCASCAGGCISLICDYYGTVVRGRGIQHRSRIRSIWQAVMVIVILICVSNVRSLNPCVG